MFRQHGHQVALRFKSWNRTAAQVEMTVTKMYGSQYMAMPNYPVWRSYIGQSSGHTPTRPFWITFRDPAHLTMILLKLD